MPAPDERLLERLAALGCDASPGTDMLVVKVTPAGLVELVRLLRDEWEFDLLLDITAVDWLGDSPRFEVVYHLYSTKRHIRVRVKARIAEENPEVDTLTSMFGSAHFMERECHEMFGIVFRGNADLRPILLYEGFVGHPLRKDYPKEREQPLVPLRK